MNNKDTKLNEYKDIWARGKQYGAIESFFLYKIVYPIVNKTGLNRAFNLFWHKIGRYHERVDGMCWWCGEHHHGYYNPFPPESTSTLSNEECSLNQNL